MRFGLRTLLAVVLTLSFYLFLNFRSHGGAWYMAGTLSDGVYGFPFDCYCLLGVQQRAALVAEGMILNGDESFMLPIWNVENVVWNGVIGLVLAGVVGIVVEWGLGFTARLRSRL